MADIVLSGAGFNGPTTVQLIAANNNAYGAASVSLDTYTQVTATFDLTGVPQGVYKVRVTNSNGQSELPAAFTVTAPGQAHLETELLLPGAVGRHIASTFYVQYSNTGDVAMPAPVLLLESSNTTDVPLFTLDPALRTSGFWTSAIPQGYSSTVQILASGKTPGVLGPGESVTVPVYYAGMQKPWDFSHDTFEFDLRVFNSTDTSPVDWASFRDSSRPPEISPEAWNVLYAGLQQQLGSTLGKYVQLLDNEAQYLGRLGENITNVSRLWQTALLQQIGQTPQSVLASANDLGVPSTGLSLDFNRQFTVSTATRFELGPLGYGWRHDWQESLAVASDGTVTVTMPSGSKRTFQPDSRVAGKYFAQIGDYGVLRNSGGTFTLTEQDGLVQFFNSDGTLQYVQDLNGNRITASYTGTQLVGLSSSSGNSLTISYSGSLITSVNSSDGRSVTYNYDANNQLITVRNYDGTITRYAYDSSGNANKANTLTSVEFRDGTHQFYAYDALGRLTTSTIDGGKYPITYSYELGKTTVTDADNHSSQYFFNELGLLVKTIDPLGHASFATFDSKFNLSSLTDAAGLAARFSYDNQGNMLSSTNPLGQTIQFTYTATGNRLATSTDALGQTTKYAYDPQGNLTTIFYADQTTQSATYDALGNPLTLINQNGQVVSNTYDAFGQLTTETLADGTQYAFTYDLHGNLTQANGAAGNILLTYDSGDRLTSVTYPDGKSLTYAYDAGGRRVRMTDHQGHVTKYLYDAQGQLAGLTDENDAPSVAYLYNSIGQLQKSQNGAAGVGPYTTYEYDAAGKILHLINFAGNGTINSRFDYSYTVLGQVSTLVTIDGTWTYSYDTVGQLVHAVFDSTNVTIPDQDLAYIYNAAGNRAQTIINGVTSTYVSNSVNEYTSVTSPDGTTTYTYDLAGNMLTKTDASGTTTYTYDSLNRLTSVTSPSESFVYEYDALGHLAASTHNGLQTTNLIDPKGLGNLVGQYTSSGVVLARYVRGLGLVSQINGNGTQYYQFGATGNTAALTESEGRVLKSYEYSPFGELLQTTGAAVNPFTFAGQFGVTDDGNGLLNMRARNYDARIGQFTANDPLGLNAGDSNIRRYVSNSPVNIVDASGFYPFTGPSPYILTNPVTEGAVYDAAIYEAEYLAAQAAANTATLVPLVVAAAATGGVIGTAINNSLSQSERDIIGEAIYNTVTGQNLDLSEEGYQYKTQQSFQDRRLADIRRRRDQSDSEPYNPYLDLFPFQSNLDPPDPPGGGDIGGGGKSKTVNSNDPNELLGPAGFGAPNFVAADATLPYEIHFENDPAATAPAQRVSISNVLSTNLDPATFRLTSIGFGDHEITVPAGQPQHFETTTSMTYNGQTFDVQVVAGIDIATRTVFAIFQSIDPDTELPPDVLTGFLPPEDGTGRGQGHVNYLIKAKAGLASGTAMRNVALITFDANDPIATNQVDPHDASKGTDPMKEALATLDAGSPTSHITALPANSPGTFNINWTMNDDAGGSGVANVAIYVKDDNGPYTLWQTFISQTSAAYTGTNSHTYAFYSIATDNVGH
ncbi:MAG: RHS repeat-associated core domain-containing protein, partial [Pirellulales bacterium]